MALLPTTGSSKLFMRHLSWKKEQIGTFSQNDLYYKAGTTKQTSCRRTQSISHLWNSLHWTEENECLLVQTGIFSISEVGDLGNKDVIIGLSWQSIRQLLLTGIKTLPPSPVNLMEWNRKIITSFWFSRIHWRIFLVVLSTGRRERNKTL